MSDNWNTGSWRPPSDNSSYFSNINQQKIDEVRASITMEIRGQAEKILNDIVTQKDSEIANLNKEIQTLKEKVKEEKEKVAEKYKTRIEEQQKEIESLKREKRHFDIPEEPEFIPEDVTEFIEATPQDFLNGLVSIIKYGKSQKGYNQEELEKVRKTVISWKKFLEDYKWKSNYISVKIKKLLLDTEKIWEE
jgi:type I site-specific restriction endonuclease